MRLFDKPAEISRRTRGMRRGFLARRRIIRRVRAIRTRLDARGIGQKDEESQARDDIAIPGLRQNFRDMPAIHFPKHLRAERGKFEHARVVLDAVVDPDRSAVAGVFFQGAMNGRRIEAFQDRVAQQCARGNVDPDPFIERRAFVKDHRRPAPDTGKRQQQLLKNLVTQGVLQVARGYRPHSDKLFPLAPMAGSRTLETVVTLLFGDEASADQISAQRIGLDKTAGHANDAAFADFDAEPIVVAPQA
ncbi:hypothetical protein K8I61_17560 [bacterium]|nr:hypothetical protein [bacterium]